MNQFRTFGNKERLNLVNKIETTQWNELLKDLYKDDEYIMEWLANRFISTCYLAPVDIEKTNPKPDILSEKSEWKLLNDLPDLIVDHNEIVQKALQQLRLQLNHLPVGLSLLPDKFTMSNLRKLYEAILNKPLERSNFQRKILNFGILNHHEKQMAGGAHKAPYLYSFDELKYNELIKNGIGFL